MEAKCEETAEGENESDVKKEEKEVEGTESEEGSEGEGKSEGEEREEEPMVTAEEEKEERKEVTAHMEVADENDKNLKNIQQDPDLLENGKRKAKEEKPPTKVVVRRLPPSMTKENFLEQVSPLPQVDYVYFVPADPSMAPNAFSRAYLNFINQDDLFSFTRTFDNYVFLDSKGVEYPAVVEFAPFQRIPRGGAKKKDTLCGTLEGDAAFQTFKEALLAEEIESSKPGANTIKQHYFETDNTSSTQEVTTTPLLEFLKARRAEKARVKEEKREEKRRKEAERKQKQKKRHDNSPDVKVLQPSKDKKDLKDKETVKEVKNGEKKRKDKEEKPVKEKPIIENRTREFKNRSGKSYQEERQKQAERREEQRKKSVNGGGSDSGAPSEEKAESREKERKEGEEGGGGGAGVGEGGSWGRKRGVEGKRKSREEAAGAKRGGSSRGREKRAAGGGGGGGGRGKGYRNRSGGKEEGGEARQEEAREEQPPREPKPTSDDPPKKDPRTERRIRNKDRPSLEIYRPGMGKFSRQRLGKEKALGSSTEVDSPTHSPSPAPKTA